MQILKIFDNSIMAKPPTNHFILNKSFALFTTTKAIQKLNTPYPKQE
jgi:hypothetical protein